ncbi:MAG: 3',5'-cyclic-AMP phosphodiesterase [Gammaproteobacteria bacterium]|nr:3',5'-cyclic-AMP phosphodiesterase [Gammaproteobacteria bacterium]MBU1656045.1 3',5'-cyclic-AMP phosphodiesterase [Gammaproteobacteria bacterium]MBU1960286.1 3',5'-cyclic-AMP phosphodiesterase [Gammaproteobacteria bacterium]
MAPLDNLPPGTLRILQITDTHLYAGPDGTLLGLNTLASFADVLRQALSEAGQADLILATGDLVHDASPEGYRTAAGMFSKAGCPVYCIPGNHDIPKVMERHVIRDGVSAPFAVRQGPWLLVMMDSTLRKGEGGHFTQEELKRLKRALDENRDTHVMICMHHQPIPVGSAWMDTMQIDNADKFLRIIDQYDNIRCLLWGHVHQTFDRERKGVRLLATPSTCIQFTPNQDDFGIDNQPPGYRWLGLLPDGRIETGVSRLPKVPPGIDFSSFGY